MFFKCFIFKARRDMWDSDSHFQYQGGMICGDMLISKVSRERMHIHMLSSQKQSGKTAVYITFRISHQRQQKHNLYFNENVCYCIFLACVRAGWRVFVCVHERTCRHASVCVCVRVCVFVHISLM